VRSLRVAATAAAFLLIVSWTLAPASARTADTFTAALIRFAIAVGGSFGDEGPRVLAALDSLSLALSAWDQGLRALEAQVRSKSDVAPATPAAPLHVELGRQYAARGRLDDALRELDQAVRLDASRADVRVLRGLVHDSAGRGAEASAEYRAAWQADRQHPASAYWMLQRHPGIARSADGQQALETLISAHRTPVPRQQVHVQAFPTLESGSRSESNDPVVMPARYQDGYGLLVRGDFQGALLRFREAAKSDPLLADPAVQSREMTAGSAALRQGRPSVARDHFQALLARMPQSSEAHRLLGVAYWADYEYEKSREQFAHAIRLQPADERSWLMLASLLVQSDDFPGAERLLREMLEVLPQSAYARLWLGSVYTSLNRHLDAANAFEAAAQTAIAGRKHLYSTVGRLRRGSGDFDGMIDALRRGLQTSPNDTAPHLELARAHLEQDERDEALAEYAAALLIDAENADAYAGIGQLHLDAGRLDEAVEVLRRAVRLQPASTEARYALASALLQSGRVEEGKKALDEFAQLQVQQAERTRRSMALDALKDAATVRASQGDATGAVALWQRVVAEQPNLLANHTELAAALVAADRSAEAVRHYEKAVALGGGPHVHKQLAALYAALGRTVESDRARMQYERALLVPTAAGGRP
jgi:tetratricopeptide (TPR) repeat protein